MSDMGFPGDPGHEGDSKPMESLKGGMAMPHTQAPMSGTNDSNPNQHDGPGVSPDSTIRDKGRPTTGANRNAVH